MNIQIAKFQIGQIVKHRVHPFRGVIFDVDPEFANSEEWWQSIPVENRPRKEQPYYHLLAENAQGPYIAYVSEQNLVPERIRIRCHTQKLTHFSRVFATIYISPVLASLISFKTNQRS